VLIPRPETELVVETVLHLLPAVRNPQSAIRSRILDVGTGSGCIAVALATEFPNAEIWATDISPDAIAVAEINAHHHNVHHRIHFLVGDLFASLTDQGQVFDIIVSNPPYIVRDDLSTLQPEVRDWEPRQALDGGGNGLDFYCRLLNAAPHYLADGGWLVLEIGHDQGSPVLHLVKEQPGWIESFCLPDYAGCYRVIAVRKS
jgi:release factor glutamine methyltransferase